MNLTEQQRKRLEKFQVSDVYQIIQIVVRNVIERSWKMRKAGATADETHGLIRFAEGMEAGALEVLNLITKHSK